MNRDTPPPEWYDPPCDPTWSRACDGIEAACRKLEKLSESVTCVSANEQHDVKEVDLDLLLTFRPRDYEGATLLDHAERVFRRLAFECRALRHEYVKEDMEAKGLGHARNFPEG